MCSDKVVYSDSEWTAYYEHLIAQDEAQRQVDRGQEQQTQEDWDEIRRNR